MHDAPSTISKGLLRSLAWDSEHFGIAVASITSPELEDPTLHAVLSLARRQGIHLVYWAAREGRQVPAPFLREFSGVLLDRKATFVADLALIMPSNENESQVKFRVVEYPKGPATDELVMLAFSAGSYSRFKLDPHIPRDKFESLYRTWIHRSTLRDLADTVLIATQTRDEHLIIGMVTISESGGIGSIGLIAVLDSFHGKGIGSLLMRAAHRWIAGHGAKQATVVTQLTNAPACALYKRVGYHLAGVQDYYHFWTKI